MEGNFLICSNLSQQASYELDNFQLSRQILETINEESSGDEESCGNWYYRDRYEENSDSETNSIILNYTDYDDGNISERNYGCPAKRARYGDFNFDSNANMDTNTSKEYMSRGHQLKRHKIFFNLQDEGEKCQQVDGASISSLSKIRLDEIHSDSSFNSLSRSSSLIQFESLEKQFKSENSGATLLITSTGNSFPTLCNSSDSSLVELEHNNRPYTLKRFGSYDCLFNKQINSEKLNLQNSASNEKSKITEKSIVETLSQDSGYCDCDLLEKKNALNDSDAGYVYLNAFSTDNNQNELLNDSVDMSGSHTSNYIGKLRHCLSNTKIDNENYFEERSENFVPLLLHSKNEYGYRHEYGCDIYDDINSQLTSVRSSSASLTHGGNKISSDDSYSVSIVPFRRSTVDYADVAKTRESISSFDNIIPTLQYRALTISLPDVRAQHTDLFKKTFTTYAEHSVSDPTDLDRIVSSEENTYNHELNSKDSSSVYNSNKVLKSPLSEFDSVMSAHPEYTEASSIIRNSNGVEINKIPLSENKLAYVPEKRKHITFDQDPTNLKTSYATSLEKCNFDKEQVSTNCAKSSGQFISSTPDLRTLHQRTHPINKSSYLSTAQSMQQLISTRSTAYENTQSLINYEQSTSKNKSDEETFQQNRGKMENSTIIVAQLPKENPNTLKPLVVVTSKPPAGPKNSATGSTRSKHSRCQDRNEQKGFLARVVSSIRFPLRRKKNYKIEGDDELVQSNRKNNATGVNITTNHFIKQNNKSLSFSPLSATATPRIVELCEKVRAGNHAHQHAPMNENSYKKNTISNEFSRCKPIMTEKCSVRTIGPNGLAYRNSVDPQHKIGLIETNLDTHETVVSGKTRSLMELGPQTRYLTKETAAGCSEVLSEADSNVDTANGANRAHKSMEFLLDKENQKNIMPPENGLQKSHDNTTALSEHQIRVQASLQRLNVPDWYRQYNPQLTNKPFDKGPRTSSYSRKRISDADRWTCFNTKATSLNSLGCQKGDNASFLTSPSAQSHHGESTVMMNYEQPDGAFSRWSTSYLNSTQMSPNVSTRTSFSRRTPVNSSFTSISGTPIRSSFRQPYMGWRSQEKLSQPRTPHERLASSMKNTSVNTSVTTEIQSSIKEVTSEIVHYVNNQTNRAMGSSRSPSPNSRKCWVESSFVGIRPTDSPQTPVIANSPKFNITQQSKRSKDYNQIMDNVNFNGVVSTRSTSSTSLQDVLSSLLGLATSSKQAADTTYRSPENSVKMNFLQHDNMIIHQRSRSCSQGDTPKQPQNNTPQNPAKLQNLSQTIRTEAEKPLRRISLDCSDSRNSDFVKCLNEKCGSVTTLLEAKKSYKSCHNCSNMYCSRECRREHWEKHRRACLHSRASNLCRQVLSTCKHDGHTFRHLSLLARNGYLSQGRGVVRILFRSPESAESFISLGFPHLGDTSFVRWPDLLPSEMGLELYSELLRLSTEYKPCSKMLIYVAICVVSEAPGTTAVPVKWERQLVSRCAKLKICKTILAEFGQPKEATSDLTSQIIILTFNSQKVCTQSQREQLLANIVDVLSRRGVALKTHYPEVYQRLHHYSDGQTEKFVPVTIYPKDSQTGQEFICIIIGTQNDDIVTFPKSDLENNVTILDVGDSDVNLKS